MKTIGIIGGGASGMMAAITAARSPGQVRILIFEHKDKIGKKILSTGNGRCNLTNELMCPECFRSEDMEAVKTVLDQFGYEQTILFFETLGLVTKSKKGYIYPRCEQAASVLALLMLELQSLGVEIHTDVHVTELLRGRKGFRILTDNGDFHADCVILAAGGRAAKVLGSDGSGYTIAKTMGHSIVPVVPALVQLKVKNHPFSKASGVRTDAKVTALIDGDSVASDIGELQITSYGISGIPVFQISRYIARGLYEKKRAQVRIDFLPEAAEEEVYQFLLERRKRREEMSAGEFLTGIFHQKLIPEILSLAGIRVRRKVKELDTETIRRLAHQCKNVVVSITDTNGFDNAQVCAGGVRLSEIEPDTMQSRYVKGLYLTGELLDVDGICGGYNLQWAWATGYIAGANAAN